MFMDERYTLFIVPELEGSLSGVVPMSKAAALRSGHRLVKGATSRAIGEAQWGSAAEPYNIIPWRTEGFEPVFVSHRDIAFHDESFGACGHDKAAHMNDLRSMQYRVTVLPEAFVVVAANNNNNGNNNNNVAKCGTSAREAVRLAVMEARVDKFPGLLRNKQFPPWIRNITLYDPKDPDGFIRAAQRRAMEDQDVDWTRCVDYTEDACAEAEMELARLQETARNLILALGAVITAIAITLLSILLIKRRTVRKR